MSLQLSDFDYPLQQHLIAQHPLPRGTARLLVYQNGSICDSQVNQLHAEIPEGSLIIVNDSKVFGSRLPVRTPTGVAGELFLTNSGEEYSGTTVFECIGKPLNKMLRDGELLCPGGIRTKITDEGGRLSVRLPFDRESTYRWLANHGQVPLPPYIKRPNVKTFNESQDSTEYQTVFATETGSCAAPTAGLHFSPNILDQLAAKGVSIRSTTLHVGLGTFLPVKTQDPADHQMHEEWYRVPAETLQSIELARSSKRPIVFVGTTTLRCIESLFRRAEETGVQPSDLTNRWQSTQLFIRPSHIRDLWRPSAGDALMTNFHQPKSTLFMMICSLVGLDEAKRIYKYANQREYRLFSYGDSSLLWFPGR